MSYTIRLTWVINKSCQISFISWIDDFSFWCLHQICTSWSAILFNSRPSFLTISWKYLSNILHNKLPSKNFLSCEESPAFSRGWFWIYWSILVLLKFSILAQLSTITSFIITLCGHKSIQTSLSAIIWYITVLKIGLLFCFRFTIAWLNLIVFRYFPFSLKINIFSD